LNREDAYLVDRYHELFTGSHSPKRMQERIHNSVEELTHAYRVVDTPAPPQRALTQLNLL
jgi:hypothetical protein